MAETIDENFDTVPTLNDRGIATSVGKEISITAMTPPPATTVVDKPQPVDDRPQPVDDKPATDDKPDESDDAFDDVSPNVETLKSPFMPANPDDFTETPLETYAEGTYELMYAFKDATDPVNAQEMTERLKLIAPQMIGHNALRRPGSNWKASMQFGDYVIGMGAAKIDTPTTNVRGSQARAILRRISNLGANIRIVLPKSCIYLEITSPGDDAMITFDYKMMTERSRLGLSTNGLLLSAASGTFTRDLVELALEHVVSTNVSNLGTDKVKALLERIDPLDYSLIINGLMAAKYPNGYPWFLACVGPNCGHKEPVKLNFGRTQRIDFSALSDEQLKMLSTKWRSITDEEIAKYKAMFRLSDKSIYQFNDKVKIHLGSGSLLGYVDGAHALKEVIEATQVKSLANYATEAQREAYINSQVQARAMRNYGHFVTKIVMEVGDDELEITDPETIVDALDDLSGDVERAADFDAHVIDWIEENTIAIVGYPTFACPVCNHTTVTKKGERFRNFIPLSIDRIFFTVTRLKSLKLAAVNTEQ